VFDDFLHGLSNTGWYRQRRIGHTLVLDVIILIISSRSTHHIDGTLF
jgi:hypothetical protein